MRWRFLLLFCWIMLFFSCSDDKGKNIPDVSDIFVDVKIQRFGQELFQVDTAQMEKELLDLEVKYPAFSDIYFGQILGSTDERIAPQGHPEYVKGFISHPSVRKLYDTCMLVFPTLDDVVPEFKQGLQYFKYYFPDESLPKITTFISEYSVGAFIYDDNALAVGLDFFLGADYPYRKYNPGNSNFSDYLIRTFNKDHLVMKTFLPLVDDYVGSVRGERFLDNMIHNGKKLHLMDLLLPHTADSVKLEMSAKQVEWLWDNELEIWAFFLQEDLLYSSDRSEFRKFVEYSPHSPGMPPEAPGRTADFLGWRIVQTYMKRFPETTVIQLMGMADAQEILTKSRYKPRR